MRGFPFAAPRGLLAAVTLALGSAAAQAPGDIRVALVIGNASYPGPAALANPVNDAKAMGDTLRGLGFDVLELKDGNKAQMQQAIEKVRDGLQLEWRNSMVPVDAQLATAAEVPGKTVDEFMQRDLLSRQRGAG